eukprot:scaffold625_cov324-Pavlova_lutheri.AAC.72
MAHGTHPLSAFTSRTESLVVRNRSRTWRGRTSRRSSVANARGSRPSTDGNLPSSASDPVLWPCCRSIRSHETLDRVHVVEMHGDTSGSWGCLGLLPSLPEGTLDPGSLGSIGRSMGRTLGLIRGGALGSPQGGEDTPICSEEGPTLGWDPSGSSLCSSMEIIGNVDCMEHGSTATPRWRGSIGMSEVSGRDKGGRSVLPCWHRGWANEGIG